MQIRIPQSNTALNSFNNQQATASISNNSSMLFEEIRSLRVQIEGVKNDLKILHHKMDIVNRNIMKLECSETESSFTEDENEEKDKTDCGSFEEDGIDEKIFSPIKTPAPVQQEKVEQIPKKKNEEERVQQHAQKPKKKKRKITILKK